MILDIFLALYKVDLFLFRGKRWYTNEYDPALMELERRKPRNLLIQFIQFSRVGFNFYHY